MTLSRNVKNALPYAQALAELGKRLVLPSNSDFVPLVRAAAPFGGCVNGMSTGEFLFRVEENSNYTHGFNEYEEINGSLKTAMVDLVRSHVRNAQKVAALVTTTTEKVQGYLNTLPDSSAIGRFTVIEDQLCDVFEEDFFQELISSSPSDVRRPDSAICGRPRTNDELMAMLASEERDLLDGLVRALSFFSIDTNGRPRQVLEEIFNGFMCNFPTQTPNYDLNTFQRLPGGERLVVALVVYLLAARLRTEVPQDAVGNLNQFASNCTSLMGLMQNSMINTFKEKKFNIENGLLILNAHYTDNSMIVDKTVYQAFLEAGGSVELILGVKVARLGLYTANEVAAGAKEAAKAWAHFAQLNNATADNEVRSFLRAIYKAAWSEAGEDILEFEKPIRSANMGLFGHMTTEAFKYIDDASFEDLKKIDCFVEHMIAKIRFGYTPSAIYISEMKKNQKLNAGAGAREDALVATIKYLTMYALTQVTVVNV